MEHGILEFMEEKILNNIENFVLFLAIFQNKNIKLLLHPLLNLDPISRYEKWTCNRKRKKSKVTKCVFLSSWIKKRRRKKSWREIADNNRVVPQDFAARFTNGRDFERNESKPRRVGEFTELLVSTGSKFPTTGTRYRIVGESRSTLFGEVRSSVDAFASKKWSKPTFGIPFPTPSPTILRTSCLLKRENFSNAYSSALPETFLPAVCHYLPWFAIFTIPFPRNRLSDRLIIRTSIFCLPRYFA